MLGKKPKTSNISDGENSSKNKKFQNSEKICNFVVVNFSDILDFPPIILVFSLISLSVSSNWQCKFSMRQYLINQHSPHTLNFMTLYLHCISLDLSLLHFNQKYFYQ